MKETIRVCVLITSIALLLVGSAAAGPTDAEKCEAVKLKRAGKLTACRMNAWSKFVKIGDSTKFTNDVAKCGTKIEEKFAKAEAKWGAECPTVGDASAIEALVAEDTLDLKILLGGGVLLPDGCGSGTIDAGESCDLFDLGGETCATLGFATGSLACTAECRLDLSACRTDSLPSRFRDNGDGTATDVVSGLMWELKDSVGGGSSPCPGGATCGNPHDADNTYTWGGAKTDLLDVLNDVVGGGASCFTGRCDWRLPTLLELRSLLPIESTCTSPPCVDTGLAGDTALGCYWTSTQEASTGATAWEVNFSLGSLGADPKTDSNFVRAVRGGL